MGTLLVAIFAVLVLVVALLAYASYRRHSRAAKARSRAALNLLLAEAYQISEGRLALQPEDAPGTPGEKLADDDGGPTP